MSHPGAASSDEEEEEEKQGEEGRSAAPAPTTVTDALLPGWAHPGYPALRRQQRLSYSLANSLPALGSGSEARQALLEAGSVSGRLRLLLTALRGERNRLAALAAIKSAGPRGEDGGEEASL